MTDSFLDYERERWLEELYEEYRPQAIEDFTTDRLRSYYLANPELARSSFEALQEARTVERESPRSSLLIASAAAEVGIKTTILRPAVHGLVHADALAGHIADLVIQHTGLDRFRTLLFALLDHIAAFDLGTYTRPGATVPLWQEIQANAELRNRVLHRCERVSPAQAALALAVASEVLDVLYVRTVEGLGFHVHDGYRTCTAVHLPDALEALIRKA